MQRLRNAQQCADTVAGRNNSAILFATAQDQRAVFAPERSVSRKSVHHRQAAGGIAGELLFLHAHLGNYTTHGAYGHLHVRVVFNVPHNLLYAETGVGPPSQLVGAIWVLSPFVRVQPDSDHQFLVRPVVQQLPRVGQPGGGEVRELSVGGEKIVDDEGKSCWRLRPGEPVRMKCRPSYAFRSPRQVDLDGPAVIFIEGISHTADESAFPGRAVQDRTWSVCGCTVDREDQRVLRLPAWDGLAAPTGDLLPIAHKPVKLARIDAMPLPSGAELSHLRAEERPISNF